MDLAGEVIFKTIYMWVRSSDRLNNIETGKTAELHVGRLDAGQGPLLLSYS